MTPDELARQHPRLYHMAEVGSWATIRALGLLTAAQIVDACDPAPPVREAVLARRRLTAHVLPHPVHGALTVRDQKPLIERHLGPVGMRDWLDELNTRVFFWVGLGRLETFLAAYGGTEHDVLVVDTAALLAAHGDRVRLTTLNTGATLFPNSPARGPASFMTLAEFPLGERRIAPSGRTRIVELAVTDGVPDVARFVLRTERSRDLTPRARPPGSPRR